MIPKLHRVANSFIIAISLTFLWLLLDLREISITSWQGIGQRLKAQRWIWGVAKTLSSDILSNSLTFLDFPLPFLKFPYLPLNAWILYQFLLSPFSLTFLWLLLDLREISITSWQGIGQRLKAQRWIWGVAKTLSSDILSNSLTFLDFPLPFLKFPYLPLNAWILYRFPWLSLISLISQDSGHPVAF